MNGAVALAQDDGQEFRLDLVWEVERAVDREAHSLRASREVLLKVRDSLVLRMLSRFIAEESLYTVQAIRPFLRTCAHRDIVRELKRRSRRPLVTSFEDMEEVAAPDSADPLLRVAKIHDFAHLMAKIQLGLGELGHMERQVLELRLKGFSDQIIAKILRTSYESVRTVACRAIHKLREIYHERI